MAQKENNIFKKTEGILYNYNKIKAEIENLELEIIHLKNNYYSMGSIGCEEKTGKTNKISNIVENDVIKRDKKLKFLKIALDEKKTIINKVDNALRTLNEKEREIITLKCIEDNNWGYVLAKTYLSQSRLSFIKRDAINQISKIIFVGETGRKQ